MVPVVVHSLERCARECAHGYISSRERKECCVSEKSVLCAGSEAVFPPCRRAGMMLCVAVV